MSVLVLDLNFLFPPSEHCSILTSSCIAMSISDDPIVSRLRHDAIRHDEWATKKYWLYIFQHYIFPEQNFVTTTEQPPLPMQTQRRIDMTVENFVNSTLFLHVIVEEKSGRATPADIVAVESQCYTGSYEHYTGNPRRRRIWTVSVTGPCIRIWAFDAASILLAPAFPVDYNYGEKASYIDFKTSEREVMEYFAFIKQNLEPPDSIFDGPDNSEILDPGSVVLVKAIRLRSQELEIELIDGGRLRTDKERWEVARCPVEGQVVNGHKYVGSSGCVYFAINVAEYL
jgi:hypothetical protein